MRLLQLFAGPYPTHQGTQTLVGQTCRLLAEAGHEVQLLCYAHAAYQREEPFVVQRIKDPFGFRSERSGPALVKPVLDLMLAHRCHELTQKWQPHLVQAHHYEALVAARLADPQGKTPLVFHAHALIGPELPTYLPPALEAGAALVGKLADRYLPRLANGAAAVSPAVSEALVEGGLMRDQVVLVRPHLESLPCSVDQPRGRRPGTITGVYSGNLDRYQNIDSLLSGLSLLERPSRARFCLEIVTASQTADLEEEIHRRDLSDLVRLVPHDSFAQAWSHQATADLSIVPRSEPGGAPIKLVNALAAGCPTLLDQRLAQELEHGKEVWAVEMNDPAQVAEGLQRLINDEILRKRLGQGAKQAAQRLHDPGQALASLQLLYNRLPANRSATSAGKTAP